MPAHNLLIIDPSVQTLNLLKNALQNKGYTVSTARDFHKAGELIKETLPSLVIVNTRLADILLLEIHSQLLALAGEEIATIALSNFDTDQDRANAKEAGFSAFLAKPIQLRSLLSTIKNQLQGRKSGERSEPRRQASIELIIHILDDRGRIIDTEQTLSENISRRGACILTLNSIEIGDAITVATLDNAFHSRAIVRGCFLGADRIRRINIEFIDEKWLDDGIDKT
jgi:DNA-binding response OmpR family regulator